MRPMSTLRALSAISLILLLSCTTTTMKDDATIFTAEAVVSGPGQKPQSAQGILVVGGLIREVGPVDDIRRANPGARVIDAGKATILPGLVDAHAHLYGLGQSLDTVNLTNTTSFAEVLQRVRERSATLPAGEWVIGRGWDQNDWSVKEFPTAADVDSVVSDRPVWLERVDGHAAIANTAALRAGGVTAATADPDGGRIIRDSAGNPTGVFVDAAMNLIDRVQPAVTFEQRKRRVAAAAQRIAQEGLTAIHDAGGDNETIRAVRELIDEGRFPIRLYVMLGDDDALLREWFARGPLNDHAGRLTVRSVKLYADGALGSRGAALLAPYSDDPGNSGLMIGTPEHIADVSRRAKSAGFQVNTHAIGDRGVRNVLDAYERAGVTTSDRFRIEHLQVIALDDIPRLARSGVIASMQPTHATSDMYWAEARLGPQRVRGAYAWRSVLSSGARLALGSDFPVEEVNPWHGIYAAVTRQDQKAYPSGGWYMSEALSLAEAIRGFTSDAAFAAFQEQSRGTIEPGKLADFTIVEGNVFAAPARDLYKTRVTHTVVGGVVVYEGK
jgi:predicted amidohydrolase YtcJ